MRASQRERIDKAISFMRSSLENQFMNGKQIREHIGSPSLLLGELDGHYSNMNVLYPSVGKREKTISIGAVVGFAKKFNMSMTVKSLVKLSRSAGVSNPLSKKTQLSPEDLLSIADISMREYNTNFITSLAVGLTSEILHKHYSEGILNGEEIEKYSSIIDKYSNVYNITGIACAKIGQLKSTNGDTQEYDTKDDTPIVDANQDVGIAESDDIHCDHKAEHNEQDYTETVEGTVNETVEEAEKNVEIETVESIHILSRRQKALEDLTRVLKEENTNLSNTIKLSNNEDSAYKDFYDATNGNSDLNNAITKIIDLETKYASTSDLLTNANNMIKKLEKENEKLKEASVVYNSLKTFSIRDAASNLCVLEKTLFGILLLADIVNRKQYDEPSKGHYYKINIKFIKRDILFIAAGKQYKDVMIKQTGMSWLLKNWKWVINAAEKRDKQAAEEFMNATHEEQNSGDFGEIPTI